MKTYILFGNNDHYHLSPMDEYIGVFNDLTDVNAACIVFTRTNELSCTEFYLFHLLDLEEKIWYHKIDLGEWKKK